MDQVERVARRIAVAVGYDASSWRDFVAHAVAAIEAIGEDG